MVRSTTTIEAATGATMDPVCGMNVPPGKRDLVAHYEGCRYYFCAEACRKAFEENPGKYLKQKPAKKKGWFGRYLKRMSRANEQQFGGGGPKCH